MGMVGLAHRQSEAEAGRMVNNLREGPRTFGEERSEKSHFL